MKDLTGTWKVKEVKMYNAEKGDLEWRSVEDIAADPNLDEESRNVTTMKFLFEGNQLVMMMAIPEGVSQEEIDAAVAEGEIALRDGMMVGETDEVKYEDGKAYYNAGYTGEVLGEPVSPWEEIIETEDGIQVVNMRFVRE